jgi:hypothetical protein
VDARLVVVGADPSLAWSRTALDVEIEAHLALLEDLVGAGPERQQLADRLDGAAQRLRRCVRAEVLSSVLLDPTRIVHARVFLRDRQLQVEVVLVVLETDVEARPVVLDEVALEDQRLHLVGRGDELEVVDLADQLGDPRCFPVARREVRAQAVAKSQRLANVYDLGTVVAEQVNAGSVRDRAQPPLDRILLGDRHSIKVS